MNCKNCKYWQEKDEGEYDGYEELRYDIHPETFERIGEPKAKFCRSNNLLFYQQPAKNQATVVDGSQYKASLITGPDFGCVNFEAGQ